MKIDLQNIKVSELVEGSEDKPEEVVRGYGGKLNIRPAYQREFISNERQRKGAHWTKTRAQYGPRSDVISAVVREYGVVSPRPLVH